MFRIEGRRSYLCWSSEREREGAWSDIVGWSLMGA